MRTRLGAAVLGVLAGLLLVVGGGMSFLDERQQEWHRLTSIGGYAVAVGALALLGYGLVATAPVWLRLVVSAGFPLLGWAVWQTVTDALEGRLDGWRAPATAHVSAGVLLVVSGLYVARRAERSAYRPAHR